MLQMSLKLYLLPRNIFDKYLHIAQKHISQNVRAYIFTFILPLAYFLRK